MLQSSPFDSVTPSRTRVTVRSGLSLYSAPAHKHRWRPDSGWVTIALDNDRAVFEVLALLRANYERGLASSDRRRAASQARLNADEATPSLSRADVQDGDATVAS